MSSPISAVMIVLNGARHLPTSLPPLLAACAEVLVLDSGSTDGSQELARTLGARVEHQDFLGFGPQKRCATALARHDWVLSIDADEVLDAEAARSLVGLELSDARRAFRVRRRNHIGTREVRHGAWNPDWCLRLFNRTLSGFSADQVHEAVRHAGPVATLPGSLLHYGYADLAEVFTRCGGYARLKAARYRASGRRAGAAVLALRAATAFTKSYVVKLGALDGAAGLVVALSTAVDAVVPLALASETPSSDAP